MIFGYCWWTDGNESEGAGTHLYKGSLVYLVGSHSVPNGAPTHLGTSISCRRGFVIVM